MGRELARSGAPFRQPEWSALALIEAPDAVRDAHAAFAAAGADVLTTNTYAVVPFHLGEERFAARGRALADLAGRLAREAADAGRTPGARRRLAAAALRLVPAGSVRPRARARRSPASSSPASRRTSTAGSPRRSARSPEAEAAAAAVAGDGRPLLVSFTLLDGDGAEHAPPRLRSGEPVARAAVRVAELGATGLLVNCSQPEVMEPALRRGACRRRRGAAARRLRERVPAAAGGRRRQRGPARDPPRPDAGALPRLRARLGRCRRDAGRRAAAASGRSTSRRSGRCGASGQPVPARVAWARTTAASNDSRRTGSLSRARSASAVATANASASFSPVLARTAAARRARSRSQATTSNARASKKRSTRRTSSSPRRCGRTSTSA